MRVGTGVRVGGEERLKVEPRVVDVVVGGSEKVTPPWQLN